MIEEISEREQAEDCKEENQPWKNGQNEVVRKRRGNLQAVVTKNVLISKCKGPFDSAELHESTIVCGSNQENTGMTVARQAFDAAFAAESGVLVAFGDQ